MRRLVGLLLLICAGCSPAPSSEFDASSQGDGAEDCSVFSPRCSSFEGCPSYLPWSCECASGSGLNCEPYSFSPFPDSCGGCACSFTGGGPTSCPGDQVPCCTSEDASSCRCLEPGAAHASAENCYMTACPTGAPWTCPCSDGGTGICCSDLDTGGCKLTGPGPGSCPDDEPFFCCQCVGGPCRCSKAGNGGENVDGEYCFPWTDAGTDSGPDALADADRDADGD
jgi:hypothetical protein